MPTPTPDQLREALAQGRWLEGLAEKFAAKIMEEILQGDEFIDEVEDLQARWGFLDLEDPDKDIHTQCRIIDEIWSRIIAKLVMRMQDTRRSGQ
jgi:nucleotidyltransferase/DNA polymerase involved in DNA repair